MSIIDYSVPDEYSNDEYWDEVSDKLGVTNKADRRDGTSRAQKTSKKV